MSALLPSKRTFGFSQYLEVLKSLEADKSKKTTLDFEDLAFASPDGMAPLAVLLGYSPAGLSIDMFPPADEWLFEYFMTAGWLSTFEGVSQRAFSRKEFARKTYIPLVQYQTGQELNSLVREVIEHFSEVVEFESGGLLALEWCIGEITDNVLVHSDSHAGWLQLTERRERRWIELVVVDLGRGIRASMSESHIVNSDLEAIKLAMERGVTRNKAIGQGNGLAGAFEIAKATKGFMNIHSGNGVMRYMGNNDLTYEQIGAHFPGTVVTMTIPFDKPIDTYTALFEYQNAVMNLEMKYVDDSGEGIHLHVAAEAESFTNRETGERLRTKSLNLLRLFPDDRLTIDFAGVEVATSSFSDEFVGKLIAELGINTFSRRVALARVNPSIQATINSTTSQRLSLPDDSTADS